HILNVNTGGTTTFGGAVGAGTALTSLITDVPGTTVISGGAVTTTLLQQYNGVAINLGANTVLNSGTGKIELNGAVSGPFDLTTNGTGTVGINGGSVSTPGHNQTYNNPVTLLLNTTINTGAGNVTFASTLNSNLIPQSLTINSTGTTTFGGAVGG